MFSRIEAGTSIGIGHERSYSVRLTEAGMLLKEKAADILSLVDRTEAEFKSREKMNSGDLYFGAPESEAMGLFAEAVQNQNLHVHSPISIVSVTSPFPSRASISSALLSEMCPRRV